MTENTQTNGSAPEQKLNIEQFVEDMLAHAQELHVVLRQQGSANDIKDRITCLKYLEDVMKTYFILKKASTHDPDSAGSTVRKYATAFKGPIGVRKARGRPRAAATELADADADDFGGDAA